MSNAGKSRAKNKANSAESTRNEEAVVYRVMIAIVILAVIIVGLIFLYSRYQKMTWFLYIYDAVYYIAIISAVCAAVCLIAALLLRKRAKPRKYLLTAMGALLALAVTCVVMRVHVWEGIVWLFIAYPAAFVLYVFYLIYPREFFFLSLESAVSGIGYFVLYKMGTTMLRPWTAALLGIFLIICALMAVLSGKDGMLKTAGLHLKLHNGQLSWMLLLITSVLCLLGLVLTLLVGGTVCLICAGAVLVWLIAMVCYYTAKLV